MQELSQADKEEAGRVPRTLEVELTRDLVDSCSAGDVVTALGVVKVLSTDAEAGKPPWSCMINGLMIPASNSLCQLTCLILLVTPQAKACQGACVLRLWIRAGMWYLGPSHTACQSQKG